MKKLAIILILMTMFISCVGRQPSRVCPPPEGQESWLCDRSAQLDITLEEVYGFIFSTSAISAVTDLVKREWICDFKKKIADWYLKLYPNITYDSIIQQVVLELKLLKDPDKILLIKNILNRNMTMYSSPSPIKQYDDYLFRKGSNQFDLDMLCGS